MTRVCLRGPAERIDLEHAWTRASSQVTLNHMTPPVSLGARRPSARGRPRPPGQRLIGVLLGWLRFAAMAVVGMLGVWLLVLLFG